MIIYKWSPILAHDLSTNFRINRTKLALYSQENEASINVHVYHTFSFYFVSFRPC